MGLTTEYTLRQHQQCFSLVRQADNATIILIFGGISCISAAGVYYKINTALFFFLAFLYTIGTLRIFHYFRNKWLNTMKKNASGGWSIPHANYEDTYENEFPAQAHALVLLEKKPFCARVARQKYRLKNKKFRPAMPPLNEMNLQDLIQPQRNFGLVKFTNIARHNLGLIFVFTWATLYFGLVAEQDIALLLLKFISPKENGNVFELSLVLIAFASPVLGMLYWFRGRALESMDESAVGFSEKINLKEYGDEFPEYARAFAAHNNPKKLFSISSLIPERQKQKI